MSEAELRELIERPTHVLHWGQPETVIPRLVSRVFGDGKKLLALAPMMYRPNRFILRIDSTWGLGWGDNNSPDEWLEEVYDAVEEEYCEWPWADDYWPEEKDNESRRVSFYDGSVWWITKWPIIKRALEGTL